MKSYNHLMEFYLSDENYYLSVDEATKHKSKNRHKQARMTDLRRNPDKYKDAIMRYAANPVSQFHQQQEINDGIRQKKRIILVPTIYEQVVHHMIVNTLKPMFMHGMYEHSYGSIPGRGSHAGRKNRKRKKGHKRKATRGGKETIEKWIRKDRRGMKYCLKLDIRNYYNSVPRSKLKQKLRKKIHDDEFFRICCLVIDVQGTDNGIPIGFYTSQWFANWYLSDLDHYIKETLRARHYVRYIDDMVIYDGSKRRLHAIKDEIEKCLAEHGLQLKSNWQIFLFDFAKRGGERVGRDLDFMGFRFYRDRTVLRRTLMLRATRKARKIGKKKRVSYYDCQQIVSYLGWIDCTKTYGMYKNHIKPFVNIQTAKRKMADHQRAVQKRKELLCG